MNTTITADPFATRSTDATGAAWRTAPFWGAIIAGAVAALALQVVLMMLGAGLGLAIYNPLTDENPIAELGTGAAVIQGLAAVVSLWAGGWVAGRFTGRAGRRIGSLHGFMVWCLATVTAILVTTVGAGWALGDLSKIVGGGLSAAGRPLAVAAGGATDLTKSSLERSGEMIGSFVDEGLSNVARGKSAADGIRAKRELGFAVTSLFTGDSSTMADSQQAVVALLVENQGMTQADARKTVAGWSIAYEKLKADLDLAKAKFELRAREMAEKSANTLSILSLCAFAAFVLGAVSATMGGKHGGDCACKRAEADMDSA